MRRHRERLVDDEPFQLATSWFPEDLARGTVLMEPPARVMVTLFAGGRHHLIYDQDQADT